MNKNITSSIHASLWKIHLILLLALVSISCGGGSSGSNPTTDSSIPASTVFSKVALAPNGICANGGVEVNTGIDTNQNGVLDADEIDNTDYLCHGTDGILALIETQAVESGINCTLGGVLIRTGLDTNGSLTLGDTEIQTSTYICNHNVSAIDGFSSLVDLSTELSGVNCVYGGQRIDTGLDANRNIILDSNEILESKYLCNGSDGSNGVAINALVTVTDEPAGINCTNGGSLVTTGLDVNDNGSIDVSEITSESYLCHGADAISSLVDILNEPAGSNCIDGGQKIIMGSDINGNGTLSTDEINKTSYICNSSGTSTSLLPADNYLIISWGIKELTNVHPECIGAIYTSSSIMEYYDLATGTSLPSYATCVSEYCSVPITNGTQSYSFSSGDSGCLNTQGISYYCKSGVFDSNAYACVTSAPVCGANDLAQCITEVECSVNGGNWWNVSCHSSCPVGQVDTSRGCETPITNCTIYQQTTDNQCIDIVFDTVTGDICGEYVNPTLIDSSSHFLTCNTTFNDVVVFEPGATVLVDNIWSINTSNIYIAGSSVSPVVISSSTGNPYGKWNDFILTGGSSEYDPLNGYISGNRMQYLQLSGADFYDVDNVVIENSSISAISIDKNYVLDTNSRFDSESINSNYSFSFNSIYTATEADFRAGLTALGTINGAWLWDQSYSQYSHSNNTPINTTLLFNDLNNMTRCWGGAFPYYDKLHLSGNNMNTLPSTTNDACLIEQNQLGIRSSLYGIYILGNDVRTVTPNTAIDLRALVLDKSQLISNATVVWRVRYDRDGVEYILPDTWSGYTPTIILTNKESYEVYVYSVNGLTDLIGHRSIRVHVQ